MSRMTLSAHRTLTPLGAAAAAGAAALVLAACSGGGGGRTGGTTPSHSANPGTRVAVTETEYALKLSRSSFAPGTYTFVSGNHGRITHALSIDGPGVEDARTKNLQSGQEGTLTVHLSKGTYDLYCPVDGHKQLGMDQHIEVG